MDWDWFNLENILPRMDSTWNGLGSALLGTTNWNGLGSALLEWTRDYHLEWTGICSTWNEAHHGESDEEHRGETLVCQRVQNRAQHGGLAGKPPSYVAIYLQNGIMRNTLYSMHI